MKVTKIALALGFVLSMSLSAQGAKANEYELNKVALDMPMGINDAKSVIKQVTESVPSSLFPNGSYRISDIEKQAYVFKRQQSRLNMLEDQIKKMELNGREEKVNLMLASLAGTEVDVGYICFLNIYKMPFASEESEAARVKFSEEPVYKGLELDLKYKGYHLPSSLLRNDKFSEYMPEAVAFDLNARINRIKADKKVRDYDVKKDLVNMEYDLNALSNLEIAELSEVDVYNSKANIYAAEIRDYINSLLLNDYEGKHQIGKLKFEIDREENSKFDDENVIIRKMSEDLDSKLNQIK